VRFRDSHSGVPGEKSHLDVGSMASHIVYYKGEGGGFPQVMWINDLLVIHANPHLRTLACPSTPEVLQVKKRTLIPFSSILFIFGLAFESFKECGGVSKKVNGVIWYLHLMQAYVSEWSLLTLPSPIPELQHAPLPFKVLWARERASTPPSSAVFYLDSHFSPSRSWECVTCPSFHALPWL